MYGKVLKYAFHRNSDHTHTGKGFLSIVERLCNVKGVIKSDISTHPVTFISKHANIVLLTYAFTITFMCDIATASNRQKQNFLVLKHAYYA